VLRRQPVGRLTADEEDWKKAIRTKLEQKVSFDFVDVPLEDVVQFLRHLTDLTIVLDPKAVESGDPKPITLRVTEMPLGRALDWIVRLADLKYVLRDNAVFITDAANAQGEEIRQLYDVIDLTFRIRDFKGDLRYLRTRTGTSISGGNGGEIEPFEDRNKVKEDDDLFTGQKLADFIKVTIAGHTWAVEKGE
jgi:type II secretory pathway component HofQ